MPRQEKSVNIKTNIRIVKGRPDLTPLVDVLFLLLIFFMLSSSFVQLSGIKVNLPHTSSVTSLGVEKQVVTVDANSRIFFNDRPIPNWDELKNELRTLSTSGRADTIIIRADDNTPFGVIARLMALAEDVELNAFVATVKEGEQDEQEVFEGRDDGE